MSLNELLRGNWIKLGDVAPDALGDARLQAHWALQVAGAAGYSQIKPTPDDSHTSVEWLDRLESLVGEQMPGGFRVGLRLRDLTLCLMSKEGDDYATLPLEGHTFADAIEWLQDRLREEAGLEGRPRIERPGYDMPEHPVGGGAKFELDHERLGELARWFANADRALQMFAAREKQAGKVRCWPHHFDVATVIELADGRSIGVGMSPGDSSFRQPYFYVTPWPVPEGDLPPLRSGGIWHRRGWTGAVLTGSKLVSNTTPERQVAQLTDFLTGSIQACRHLSSVS
ncbi:MAG: hypothetical protein K8I27_14265 [Planctomycetes bacterium]|nr:hypothetical protein [Planctomycetota bacterium]